MRRGLYLLLAISLGLNAGLLYVRGTRGPGDDVPHQRPPRHAPHPRVGQVEDIIDDHVTGMTTHLGLSPEQQAAVRAVLGATMPELHAARRRDHELNRLLSESYAAVPFDGARFRDLARQATTVRARIDSLAATMLLGEAELLTAEQRRRFAEVAPSIHVAPERTPGPRRAPGDR